jgi:hypothetical protein
MKALRFLSIILFGLPLLAVSQMPLLDESRLWSMVNVNCQPWGNAYTSHYLKIGGDTLINGIEYKKLDYSANESQTDWIDYGGYIRETQDGKVYYTRLGFDEGLIYDFSAALGDTVVVLNVELLPEPLEMVVILEDSILLEDGWHRMLVLEDEDYPGEETWIEGVGSLSGLVKSCLSAFGSACGDYDLLCSSDNGVDIYINPEYPTCWYVSTRIDNNLSLEELKVYPNPVRNILTIDGEFLRTGETYEFQLTDIAGRVVINERQSLPQIDLGNLQKGIYFLQLKTEEELYSAKVFKY